jgi:hypothetical protein
MVPHVTHKRTAPLAAMLAAILLPIGCSSCSNQSTTSSQSQKSPPPGTVAEKEKPKTIGSCIRPPELSDSKENKIAGEISARLAKLPVNAQIKGEYETVVKEDFQKLSDSNAALLLFLRAIECFSKEGVDPLIIRQMVEIVRARWGAAQGISGQEKKLTALERKLIAESPHGKEIMDILRKEDLE